MMITGLQELEINPLEYCFTVSRQHVNSSSFMVRIPKLMPNVAPSDKSTRTGFNNNILINAQDCMPKASSSVTMQGFYTVKRFRNVSLCHHGDITGHMSSGQKLIATVMDKNIRDIYITDNI